MLANQLRDRDQRLEQAPYGYRDVLPEHDHVANMQTLRTNAAYRAAALRAAEKQGAALRRQLAEHESTVRRLRQRSGPLSRQQQFPNNETRPAYGRMSQGGRGTAARGMRGLEQASTGTRGRVSSGILSSGRSRPCGTTKGPAERHVHFDLNPRQIERAGEDTELAEDGGSSGGFYPPEHLQR